MRDKPFFKFLNLNFLLLTFIVLVLSILPLPVLMSTLRPAWLLLFVLYLQFYAPQYFNLFFIFIAGIVLDVLLFTPLGEHSVALLLTTFLISSRARRVHHFNIGQQMFIVLLLVVTYQTSILLTNFILGYQYNWLNVIGSACTSLIFWAGMRVVGDSLLADKLLTTIP